MSKHKKISFSSLLALVVILSISISTVFASPGVVADINFEIDGDIPDNLGATDWGNASYPPANLIVDPHSKSAFEPNIFKPAGKFDDPANWSIQDGSVGSAQAELTNIFAWAIAPDDFEVGSPTDSWLVMGMERTKKEGTFALDFEFNQNGWDGASGTLVRTPGDITVGFELKGNPSDPQEDLQVLIVVFSPGDQPSLCDVTIGKGKKLESVVIGTDPCPAYGSSGWYYRFLASAALLSDLGEATMNASGFAAPAGTPTGYISYDSHGNQDDFVGAFEFAEAAINLTELGLDPGCPGFGSVHAKSRSSLEVGSDLKDLAGPQDLPVKCYIEGYKYLDVDGDGQKDDGEPALENWEIQLSGTASDVAYTDAAGYYLFDDLANGVYAVDEVCPSSEGWVQTDPGATDFSGCGSEGYDSIPVNLDNRITTGINFGNGQPAIEVTKICTLDVFVGDDINYTITVTNTGNVDLYGVSVLDNMFGELGPIDLPAGGDAATFNPTHTATAAGIVENSVTASGDYAQATVSASEDCTSTVHELTVTKNANTSFTRTYAWTIDKSVDQPGPITVAPGSSVELNYTVAVDLAAGYPKDSDWAVEGVITISNPAPMDASLASVSDMVSPDIAPSVSCPSLLTVPAGGSLQCTYSASLPDAATRTNTATATLNNNNGGTTDFSGTADVDFASATITYIDEEIVVTDDYLDSIGAIYDWTADALTDTLPKEFTYSRTVDAPLTFCGTITVENTATFVTNDTGTSGSDSVTVIIDVPCEGCTPGFWQGGAGSPLWDEGPPDLDWTGVGTNPFVHTKEFNDFFDGVTDPRLDEQTMYQIVRNEGGSANSAEKAARDMVAAYLNESAFPGTFPADLTALVTMWYDAVILALGSDDSGYDTFHNLVAGWNAPEPPGFCPLP